MRAEYWRDQLSAYIADHAPYTRESFVINDADPDRHPTDARLVVRARNDHPNGREALRLRDRSAVRHRRDVDRARPRPARVQLPHQPRGHHRGGGAVSDFTPGWKCPVCHTRNSADRTDCRRCGTDIPEGDG